MRSYSLLAILIMLFVAPSFAQTANDDQEEQQRDRKARYLVQVDPDFAMGSGAETILTVHRLTELGDDRWIDDIDFGKDGWKRAGAIATRGLKVALLDSALARWLMVIQHEAFGHAARAREFGYRDIRIRVSAPWPYGDGTGQVSSIPRPTSTLQEDIALRASGMQSTGLLSHRLAFKWLENKTIDHREALLYMVSFHDATGYIRDSLPGGIDPATGDPANYVAGINRLYSRAVLDLGDLRDRVLVNSLDSFSWLAFWTEVKYLSNGDRQRALKMIPSGPVEWLPGARLGLSPFGTEYIIGSYYVYRDRLPGYVYVRYGDDGGDAYSGLGIETRNVYRGVDIKVDLWLQADIDATQSDIAAGIANRTYGGALTLRTHIDVSSRYGLTVEAGIKSKGFLVGEPFLPSGSTGCDW